MELKDILHYYLGCECKFGVFVPGQETVFYGQHIDTRVIHNVLNDLADVKPILRRLSSMTEEEAIECAKLSEWEPHFRDVKVERTKFGDLLVKWDGIFEGGEQQNVTGDMFYCAEQFHYLLSKHFDLFGLIDSNQAIDRDNQ